jgi:leader peptidase (prepilin peptidase)/N-methyltransferase
MVQLPIVLWAGFALVLGLVVGSFLNVWVARLPFEKSLVWPSSRCFTCYRPIRSFDNIPVLGYLLLRGRCRNCGAAYSARYLWVEVGTGVAFLALFLAEVVFNWFGYPPGFTFDPLQHAYPPPAALAVFAYHAAFVSLLIAAGVIDAGHRIIPPLVPFTGLAIGVAGSAFIGWPWPHPPAAAPALAPGQAGGWLLVDRVPLGVQPWPFWGPLFDWFPAGSWRLGLLDSVIGALAGSLVVRAIKWSFETGFGKEALGLGDADLLMMAGAFLGFQPVMLSLFVGAVAALVLFKLPQLAVAAVRRTDVDRELPFGPGLAAGVVITWFGWPWLGPKVRPLFFDPAMLGLAVGVVGVGMLAAGLLLRKKEAPAEAAAVAAK